MKKFLMLIIIIGIAPLLGGLYGILHDQLTYTISPEYYTKFKFYQFGLTTIDDAVVFPNPRLGVSKVGFMATWWMGLPIGLILGLFGLIHKGHTQMFHVTIRAIIITIIVAFTTGIIGLAYGKFHLTNTGVNWWLPENLIDKHNFIAVGSMHNFSYLGGLAGLITGILYSIRQKQIQLKLRNESKNDLH